MGRGGWEWFNGIAAGGGLPTRGGALLTSTDPAEVIQLIEQAFAELELAA